MQTKTISFFSTKGGVGKTIISLNTAIKLAEKFKVLFIDFDLSAPQTTERLLENLKVKYALVDLLPLLKAFKEKEKDIANYLAKAEKLNFYFIPAIKKVRQAGAINAAAISDFLSLFQKENFDFIIIDTGSSLTDGLLTIFDNSNLMLIVLTPDVLSIYHTQWTLDTLQTLGFPLKMMRIVLNRAESKGAVSWQEIKVLLNTEAIAFVPSDGKTVGLAVNKGVPFVIGTPHARISAAVKELADKIASQKELYIPRTDLEKIRVKKEQIERKEESLWKRLGLEEVSNLAAQEEDEIVKLKKRIHQRLIEKLDLKRFPVEKITTDANLVKELKEQAEKIVSNLIAEETQGFIKSFEVRRKISHEIIDEALGLGPLEDLIADSTVTEIMVNNKNQVFVERSGKLELTTKKFTSNSQVRTIIERILAPLGRRIDESSPYVDARLPDGSRVNAIIPPLSLTGPTLTIRKFAKERYSMDDLIKRFGSLTEDMALFLEACVKVRKNILVSGGTGSGKTTFLNILSQYIPEEERIITIEDSAELKLHQSHWIRLESRPPNIEGRGAITISDLFRNTLRMRPDRIIVGEVRGIEVLDMLQAMNTGHDGSMSTIHANSTHDVLIRLDSMILMSGVELPIRAIREMISSAIDLIVHTSRLSDGSRRVMQITEVAGMLDEVHIDLKDIFSFKQEGVDSQHKVIGHFHSTGYIPSFYDDIISRGISLSRDIFAPQA